MAEMTVNEIADFLQTPRNAIVGANRANGSPQLTPVWFLYEDGRFYISVTRSTAKYRHLQRDPRITLCIDGGSEDARTVIVYGAVQFVEHGESLQQEMRWRLIRHYIADEAAARAYEELSREWDSVLLIITPTKVISQDLR